MAERHVIAVEHVLELELPVAVVDVAVHADVERELAVGRAVDEIVDVALHRADMVLEARAVRARGSRTQSRGIRRRAARARARSRPCRNPRRSLPAPARSEACRRCRRSSRGSSRPAAVAWPLRSFTTLAPRWAQRLSSTCTLPSRVPAHDHRLAAEIGGDVVARVRHLAGVADEQPGAAEHALHLELEHVGVGSRPAGERAPARSVWRFLRRVRLSHGQLPSSFDCPTPPPDAGGPAAAPAMFDADRAATSVFLQHVPALEPVVGALHLVGRDRRGIADQRAGPRAGPRP